MVVGRTLNSMTLIEVIHTSEYTEQLFCITRANDLDDNTFVFFFRLSKNAINHIGDNLKLPTFLVYISKSDKSFAPLLISVGGKGLLCRVPAVSANNSV